MTRAWPTAVGTALLVLSCLGCSLALDTEKRQCKRDADCPAPFECSSAQLCQPASCTSDASCQERGTDWLETLCEAQRCVEAECSESAECESATDACIDGRCVEAECLKNEDCTATSPTATCQNFMCVDLTWACLGKPDVRAEQAMSDVASVQVKVLYAFAQDGAVETGVRDLSVKVCQVPDRDCANPLEADWRYEQNALTLEGLESGFNYRIQLTARHPTKDLDLLPGEYIMYRTAVGDVVEPKPMLMFEASVRDLMASQADVNLDPSLGLLLARIFDCEEKEVAGIGVSIDKITTGCAGECPTTIFYQNTNNLPDPGATETNISGRAGIVNMAEGKFNRITLTRNADGEKITSFVITPHAGWVTYSYFYPWDYGTAAD